MCGRYIVRRIDAQRYGVKFVEPMFEEFVEHPRWNIAPSQKIGVIRLNSKGERVLGTVKWGLVPHWAKALPKVQPINARAETVATSGPFRDAFSRRRCLIPADGFYEWCGVKPPKQPWFIHLKNSDPFALAGLWERWKPSPDAEPLDTCTILTTSANELVAPIHNRMPVILSPDDYARWLDRELPGERVADLLKPFPAEEMEALAISTRVNDVRNDDEALIEPQKSE